MEYFMRKAKSEFVICNALPWHFCVSTASLHVWAYCKMRIVVCDYCTPT